MGSVNLAGVNQSDFDEDYVEALEDGIAESISDDPSSVEVNVTGFTEANGTRRRLALGLSVQFTAKIIAEEVGITVVSVDDVFDKVLAKIETSVSSGDLASGMNTKLVEKKGADAKTVAVDSLAGDKAAMVVTQLRTPVPSGSPTYAPSMSPIAQTDNGSSGGVDMVMLVVIIVIAVLVLVALVGVVVMKKSNNKVAVVSTGAPSGARTVAVAPLSFAG